MNEILATINNVLADEDSIMREIKNEMTCIVQKTSRVARLVGAFCDLGHKPVELVEDTGLSRTTLSKMNIASDAYKILLDRYADESAEDIERLLDIPYTFIYNHHSEINGDTLNDMSVDDAIAFLTRKSLSKQDSEDVETDSEDVETDSEDVETDIVNITIRKENINGLIHALKYYLCDYEDEEISAIIRILKGVR